MPLDALALALTAALLHALWNLLLAREHDTEAAAAVAVSVAGALDGPAGCPDLARGERGDPVHRDLGNAGAGLRRPPGRRLPPLRAERRLPGGARARAGARADPQRDRRVVVALGRRGRRGPGRCRRRAARPRLQGQPRRSSGRRADRRGHRRLHGRRPLRDPPRERGALSDARAAASGGRLSAVRRAAAVREGVRARDGGDRRRLGRARTCSSCSRCDWPARPRSPPSARRAS